MTNEERLAVSILIDRIRDIHVNNERDTKTLEMTTDYLRVKLADSMKNCICRKGSVFVNPKCPATEHRP